MGLHLIALIGPPAVGKLTVGRVLAAELGYRLLHNHLTFDLAHRLHPYGTKEFFDLCDVLRLKCLSSVARAGTGGLVTTFCAGGAADLAALDRGFAIVAAQGGRSICVALEARTETLLTRAMSPERRGTNKIHDPVVLSRVLKEHRYSAIPDSVPVIRIDTDGHTAESVKNRILERLASQPGDWR